MTSPRELLDDSRVLWQMLRGQSRGGSAAERLEAFYAPQASRYDRFRERLLNGRTELVSLLLERLSLHQGHDGAVVVELGGGTGSNIDRFGSSLRELRRYVLVDLCPSLLAQAKPRARLHGDVVELVEADVTRYQPPAPVDCVFFSYSLTMIDDWRAALDNALAMLKPGGWLGVVDFYVSAANPAAGWARHPAWERWFWRRWFGHDGVRLSPDHLEALTQALPSASRLERRGRVPYLGGLEVPYYLFVGQKDLVGHRDSQAP